MEMDAKWRIEHEPYTGSKQEICKNTKNDQYCYGMWRQKEQHKKAERDAEKKKLAWAGTCMAYKEHKKSMTAHLKDFVKAGRISKSEFDDIVEEEPRHLP